LNSRIGKRIAGLFQTGNETERISEPEKIPLPASWMQVPEMDENDFPEAPLPVNLLSLTFMKSFRFLPLNDSEESVTVAMADPSDMNTREVIHEAYGKPVKVFRASEETISQFIYRWYEADADMNGGDSSEEADLSVEEQLWDSPEHLKDMASEAPVIRLVNHLISKALDVGASDIHIEPRRQSLQVRYRIDGILHNQDAMAPKLTAAITSRIKLMAKMDIAEMRLPQDGRIKFRLGKDEIDIRVSSVPVQFGESLVLRLLHQEDINLELDSLGFPEKVMKSFQSIISMPHGIVLVCGPTGAGKTTTLYAALNRINSPDKKIVTVEDPVEYQLEGINQVQIKPKIGLTFANCLRSFLRHDPDVMLVGEIRDVETAEIAVQSALTGHMVFSTLHTNDAAGAITRLEDIGIEPFMIASSLVAVLAQRLVRRICPHCREDVRLSGEEKVMLARDLEVAPEEISDTYQRGTGCKECGGTGYRDRVGIFELLVMSEAIQRAVLQGTDRLGIYRKALAEGMTPLRMSGLEKVRQGITTYEEVLRVAR
jgi:general secretion pathway protein E